MYQSEVYQNFFQAVVLVVQSAKYCTRTAVYFKLVETRLTYSTATIRLCCNKNEHPFSGAKTLLHLLERSVLEILSPFLDNFPSYYFCCFYSFHILPIFLSGNYILQKLRRPQIWARVLFKKRFWAVLQKGHRKNLETYML